MHFQNKQNKKLIRKYIYCKIQTRGLHICKLSELGKFVGSWANISQIEKRQRERENITVITSKVTVPLGDWRRVTVDTVPVADKIQTALGPC